MTCFLLIVYLKMTYLCISNYIFLINPSIEIVRVISPFDKISIFVSSNNFFYNIYTRSVFSFL